MITSELGLDGVVRPVKGLLAIAIEAKKRGRTRVIVCFAAGFMVGRVLD